MNRFLTHSASPLVSELISFSLVLFTIQIHVAPVWLIWSETVGGGECERERRRNHRSVFLIRSGKRSEASAAGLRWISGVHTHTHTHLQTHDWITSPSCLLSLSALFSFYPSIHPSIPQLYIRLPVSPRLDSNALTHSQQTHLGEGWGDKAFRIISQ